MVYVTERKIGGRDYTIRNATRLDSPNDIEFFEEIAREFPDTSTDAPGEFSSTFALENAESLEQDMGSSKALYLICEDSKTKEYVGCGAIYFCRQKRRAHTADICNIATKKEYRRQGIASAIIEELERVAKNNGVESVCLVCMAPDADALHFYAKRGYFVCGSMYQYLKLEDGRYVTAYYLQKYLK